MVLIYVAKFFKNNKKPCISISEIEKLSQTKEIKNDNCDNKKPH